MRVICVKHFERFCKISFEPMERPEIGDEDVVTETITAHGASYYKLERFGIKNNYRTDFFATLPDPSEEVGIEAEQEAIIYQR